MNESFGFGLMCPVLENRKSIRVLLFLDHLARQMMGEVERARNHPEAQGPGRTLLRELKVGRSISPRSETSEWQITSLD